MSERSCVCKNPVCASVFLAACGRQLYCSRKCRRQHAHASLPPEKKLALNAKSRAWSAGHPVAVKQKSQRQTAKRYLTGKLPDWMYS